MLKRRGGRIRNLRPRLGTTMPSWRGTLCNVVDWSMFAFVEATFLKPFRTMSSGRRLALHAQQICLTRERCAVHPAISIDLTMKHIVHASVSSKLSSKANCCQLRNLLPHFTCFVLSLRDETEKRNFAECEVQIVL